MTGINTSTTNTKVAEFLKKTNYINFNAYRIDLNLLIVNHNEDYLLVNDAYLLLADYPRAKATCRVMREDYIRAFYFLEDSIKDDKSIRRATTPIVSFVALRKEFYDKDGVRQRLWFETYNPTNPVLWTKDNPILNIYNKPITSALPKQIVTNL